VTHWSDGNDLSILKAFGQQVSFVSDVDTVTAYGLYERQFVEYAGVEGYKPTISCRTSDVADVVRSWTVEIDSLDYTVVGKQDGGTGLTVFILEPSAGSAADSDGGDGFGGSKWDLDS